MASTTRRALSAARATELYHAVASGSAVYFSGPRDTGRGVIRELLLALASATGSTIDDAAAARHEEALTARLAGEAPWSRFEQPWTREDEARLSNPRESRFNASLNHAENAGKRRGYWTVQAGPFVATLDSFNPCDELRLGYRGVEVPTLMLLLSSRALNEDVTGQRWFYETIRTWDDILQPQSIVGTALIASLAGGYAEQRIPQSVSPWSFLYPITVVDNQDIRCSTNDLKKAFPTVMPWSRGRTFLQQTPGLAPPVLVTQSRRAARLVGRVAAYEVLEGRYPASFLPASDTADGVVWPTPVRDDETAPTSVELMGAANGGFVRQAVYQVKAGDVLQGRGHTIRALQVPFVSDRIRITIPIVLDREPKIDAGSPWARCVKLQRW